MEQTHVRADDPRYLTVAQAAEASGVKPRTIRSWCTKGYLRRYRIKDGYHIRVSGRELKLFVEARAAERAR